MQPRIADTRTIGVTLAVVNEVGSEMTAFPSELGGMTAAASEAAAGHAPARFGRYVASMLMMKFLLNPAGGS